MNMCASIVGNNTGIFILDKGFFTLRNLELTDRLVLNLEMALIFSGSIGIILNAVTFRYNGDKFLSENWFWLVPLLIFGVFFSSKYVRQFPGPAYFLKSYSLNFLAFFAFLVMIDGVQFTPFPTIDSVLSLTDHALHIEETTLMNWVYAHSFLLLTLKITYKSLVLQWLLIPLILFITGQKERFPIYLIISLLAYLFGAGVYYFFPSLGPASIYSNKHFSREQLELVLNFKEIHQYLMVTPFEGGMIAFPSFHVLWSVIIIYILKNSHRLLFSLILALNGLAILATLFLGWDYAGDIICGVAVGFVAIYLGKRLLKNAILLNNT